MKVNYSKIIEVFEKLASKHLQINSFVDNHPLQINSKELNFPVLAIYPGLTRMDKGVVNMGFKMFIMDLQTGGYTGERSGLSSTLLIGNDIIKKLFQSEDEYGFVINEETVVAEPFAENFKSSEKADIEDDVVGWYFSFDIEVQDDYDSCNLPFAE